MLQNSFVLQHGRQRSTLEKADIEKNPPDPQKTQNIAAPVDEESLNNAMKDVISDMEKAFLNPATCESNVIKARSRSQSPVGDSFTSSHASKSLDNSELTVEMRRKLYTKSQDIETIDESNVNFNQNRELWQKRASSQSSYHIATTPNAKLRQIHTPDLVMDLPLVGNSSPKEQTKKSISLSAGSFTDLSSGEEDTTSIISLESPPGPESPDMSTAAERFAKQNQCTLKKNTKVHAMETVSATVTNPQENIVTVCSPLPVRNTMKLTSSTLTTTTTTFKPQIKAKPQVLRKPVLSFTLPSVTTEIVHSENTDIPL